MSILGRDVLNEALAALHAAVENQPLVKALFEPFLFGKALLAGHGTANVFLVNIFFRDADIIHSQSLSFFDEQNSLRLHTDFSYRVAILRKLLLYVEKE